MCLAVPGKLIEMDDGGEPRMGTASFGGVKKRICVDWVPGIQPGDYVIVHVGFAIARLDEEEAKATLELLEGIDGMEADH